MSSPEQADFGVNEPAPGYGRLHFTSANRGALVAGAFGEALVYVKRARLVAVQMDRHFEVATDQGIVAGKPGDWLATNHPNDDPGSDVWVVSDQRMSATYELDGTDHPEVVEAAGHVHGHDEGLEHYWTGRRFSINELVTFLTGTFAIDTETARLRVQELAEEHPI